MAHVRDVSRPSPVRRVKPSIPRKELDWAASGWAGLAGGAVFLFLATLLTTLFTGGPNADVMKRIAAIALGQAVLPPANRFTVLVFLAAMAVHLPLSLLYARILAVFVDRRPAAEAVAIGAAFGVLLYAVNFHLATRLFPWFAASRGWIMLVSHVGFGVVAAGLYASMERRRTGGLTRS